MRIIPKGEFFVKWHFVEHSRLTKQRDSIGDEFFANDDPLSGVKSVIRESIQNSLDAGPVAPGPVRVRFALGSAAQDVKATWFAELQPHIQASLGSKGSEIYKGSCRYLVIEDFNTSGLRGDPHVASLVELEDQGVNDKSYYYFVRAEGASDKSGGTRGTWGVGKIVYPKFSQLKTFLIYSIRAADQSPARVALGQAILKSHVLDGVHYEPDGWMAQYSASEKLQLPIAESDADSLAKDFSLARAAETGLSLVIPFVPDLATADNILFSIVTEYYVPLATGELVCEVVDVDGVSHTMDSLTLEAYAARFADQSHDLAVQVSLAKAIALSSSVKFRASYPADASNISELEMDDESKSALTQALNRGENCEITIDLTVANSGGSSTRDSFVVLMKAAGDGGQVRFCRSGIMVGQMRTPKLVRNAALVVVRGGALEELLASAEGPAHDRWDTGARKYVDKYGWKTSNKNAISFVRQAASQVEKLLQSQEGVLDYSLLSEFFPSAAGSGRDAGTGKRKEDPLPPSLRQKEKVLIAAKPSGFSVKKAFGPETLVGKELHVSAAYKLSRGNSFSRWNENDFLLADLVQVFDSKKLELVSVVANKAVLRVISDDFEYSVSGFDLTLRDIEVDVRVAG
jgi:hypothetical protein